MIIKSIVCLVFSSSLLFAEEEKHHSTAIQFPANSAKIGGDYRIELENNDHGLMKSEDEESHHGTSTHIHAHDFKLKLEGMFEHNVSYKLRVKFNQTGASLDYGVVSLWPTEKLGLELGTYIVKEGGFENQDSSSFDMLLSPYTAYYAPFMNPAPYATIKYKLAGTLSLQLLDDVSIESGRGRINKHTSQPAGIIEWASEPFGIVSPLLQVAQYDAGRSMFTTIGAKTEVQNIRASFDYTMDQRAKRGLADSSIIVKDQITNVVLSADYTIPHVARPFVKFAKFDVKQAANSTTGDTDKKGNTTWSDLFPEKKSEFDETMSFNDNALVWSVGSFFLCHGEAFIPFVAVIGRSGDFVQDSLNPSKTQSRSDVAMKLGVIGEF